MKQLGRFPALVAILTSALAGGAHAQIDTTQLPGSNIGTRVAACITALGSTGGICDSRKEISSTNVVTNNLSITANITWLLPPATITFNSSSATVNLSISGSGARLVGQGMDSTILDFSNNFHLSVSPDDITVAGSGVRLSNFQVIGSRTVFTSAIGGNGVVLGSSGAVTDDIVDHIQVINAGKAGISAIACTRCYIRDNVIMQSATNGIEVNANAATPTTDVYVLNNTLVDTNCGCPSQGCTGGAANGAINVETSGNGGLSGVVVSGNIIRNMSNAPNASILGITSGGLVTLTTPLTLTLILGQSVEITGVICNPASPCFNGVYAVAGCTPSCSASFSAATSFTIVTPPGAYLSGGTATWGPGTGAFMLGTPPGHNPLDTGNFEGIQLNKSTANITVTNNQLFHVRSEGIVVSSGPVVVENNNLNQVGEDPIGGVGGVLIGGATCPIATAGCTNQSVIVKSNAITDASYGITLSIAKKTVNMAWQLVDVEGNTVGTISGAPVTQAGFRAVNNSIADTSVSPIQQYGGQEAVTSYSCATLPSRCTVAWTAPTMNTTCTGTTWSVRGIPNPSGGSMTDLNGDFPVASFTGGAMCSGFTYANTLGLSFTLTGLSGPVAYASQFVNTLIVANNDFTGATTGISLWQGNVASPANTPSGTVDIHGNKELVAGSVTPIFQGFYDVYGPAPNYNNSGGIVHRFTAGHFQNLQSAVPVNNLLTIPLSSGKTAGGIIHYFVDAIKIAGGTLLCTYTGTVQYAGINDGSGNASLTLLLNPLATAPESVCSSGQSILMSWTSTPTTTAASVNVMASVTGFTPAVMHIYYSVDHYGAQDPTYLPNPPRPD